MASWWRLGPSQSVGAFDSTPMLNKIGISNPSPGAYYYLDLMGRNKKLLFDISIDTTPDKLLDAVIQQAETLNSPDGDYNPTADSDHEADDPI